MTDILSECPISYPVQRSLKKSAKSNLGVVRERATDYRESQKAQSSKPLQISFNIASIATMQRSDWWLFLLLFLERWFLSILETMAWINSTSYILFCRSIMLCKFWLMGLDIANFLPLVMSMFKCNEAMCTEG